MRIPLDELVVGGIYEVHSRNLRIAVWTGNERRGFVGVREKFGDRYLFEEYARGDGEKPAHSMATVSPLKLIGHIPEGVDPVEHYWDEAAEGGKQYRSNPALLAVLEAIEKETP
jgi:hypothetical protein